MTLACCPWFVASIRIAIVLALLSAAAGTGTEAATYLKREIEIRLEAGAFTRVEVLEVRLDDSEDVADWGRHPIWLNDHIALAACEAEVRDGEGRTLSRIPRRKHERFESAGYETYTSQWASLIPFPDLQVGQVVALRVETREEPYFPAALVALLLPDAQESLSVRVSGDPHLRWRLDGDARPFRMEEKDGVLQVAASGVPALQLPRLTPRSYPGAALRLAWGDVNDWPGVGSWYGELTRGVPPAGEAVRRTALALTAGFTEARDKLAALTTHVKQKVRYEDVEIGVGGYVPSASEDVLSRAWGDCKDKAELLRQMLDVVGIPSFLVLLQSGWSDTLDLGLATNLQFNHAILAVEAAAAAPREGDPVYGGYLLIDPTWERGGVGWLPPTDRGRSVLVAAPGGGDLVAVPDDPDGELTTVNLSGDVNWLGDLAGRVEVLLRGARAVFWMNDLATRDKARTEESLRSLVSEIMPGSRLSGMAWEEIPGEVPALRLTAGLEMERLVREKDGEGTLLARGQAPFPETRLLDDRTVPVALRAGRTRTTWSLSVPEDWCPVEPREDAEENTLGRVVATVAAGPDGRGLQITRETEIRRSRVDPDAFDQLKALALADSRADKRRVRLRCPESADQ